MLACVIFRRKYLDPAKKECVFKLPGSMGIPFLVHATSAAGLAPVMVQVSVTGSPTGTLVMDRILPWTVTELGGTVTQDTGMAGINNSN